MTAPDLPSVPVRQVGPYTWTVATVVPPFDPAETARLRTRVAALEAECAALTEALNVLAHDFTPAEYYPTRCDVCTAKRVLPVHRTPAVVRAELEGQQ